MENKPVSVKPVTPRLSDRIASRRQPARAMAQSQQSGGLSWGWAALLGLIISFAMIASAQARSAPESFADLAEKLSPSVVNISTSQTIDVSGDMAIPDFPQGFPFGDQFREFFERHGGGGGDGEDSGPRERRASALGSGFIIDSEGYIVTNNHVVEDADEITVILQDDTRLEAKLIGRDAKTDLALLKVESDHPLPAAPWGDSDKTRVGDWVVAIGNPFGFGGTVTAGIVSARSRDIRSGPYDDFFQTDAPINKGNSGGPLFNMEGQVIGVNTAIFSPNGASVGIGFSRASNQVQSVIGDLKEFGRTRRGWLGVHVQTVTDELAENFGLSETTGALVASVAPEGPAEKSGIEPGDIILKFDNRIVEEMRRLPRMVAETSISKKVPVLVWRNGKEQTVPVTLGELEEQEPQQVAAAQPKSPTSKGGETDLDALGLTVAPTSESWRERFELDEDARGVVVTKVDRDSQAATKGLRPGDLILEVGQQKVASPKDVADQVERALGDEKKFVLLRVQNKERMQYMAINIDQG